jgi:YtkA-like
LRSAGEQLAVSVVAAMPEEPERYINQWTVELERLDGASDPDAAIVRGETFMPIHGHDGRVQPNISALSDPGRFEIDRLNFTMRGPWEVHLWLRSGTGDDDYVVIDVCVAR